MAETKKAKTNKRSQDSVRRRAREDSEAFIAANTKKKTKK